MKPKLVGAHPLATDEQGPAPVAQSGRSSQAAHAVVTLPGMIHFSQREAHLDLLDAERKERGRPPFADEERNVELEKAVDLIIEEDKSGNGERKVLIHANPTRCRWPWPPTTCSRNSFPARQVRFLNVRNQKIRDALKRRGQVWRITPLPTTHAEMEAMIASSRIAVGGREIYYFNNATGTRYLTFEEFARAGGTRTGGTPPAPDQNARTTRCRPPAGQWESGSSLPGRRLAMGKPPRTTPRNDRYPTEGR